MGDSWLYVQWLLYAQWLLSLAVMVVSVGGLLGVYVLKVLPEVSFKCWECKRWSHFKRGEEHSCRWCGVDFDRDWELYRGREGWRNQRGRN